MTLRIRVLFESLDTSPSPSPSNPPSNGVVQGYVSLGYLCKYVNQRLVGWNLCGTCNCTIDHFFLLGGVGKQSDDAPLWCNPTKCTCVFFSFF